ncbi:LysR family transcriptional regulator [Hwanghaeella grinnelliae]|uniref:LysR family transcriptional regulator n=1 Tax=Hwanghaeella grinnelliae TaxID=2500179 RepID=A0A3S2VS76_9PROT|nr:LysR family transcriptional regulator [Hwanghaeella grinnelliae]RVU38513.1 LysR family transcriptional regulator [Hwanghaeella grinnelliae]
MAYLDRRHFRLLTALSEHKKLGLAASALGLSQPAASHQIREAERRLGISLITKTGNSVSLTSAGEHLATIGKSTEKSLSDAEADAIWLSRDTSEALRFAIGVSERMSWLPDAVAKLAVQEPNLRIELVQLRPSELQSAVMNQEADCFLTAGVPGPGLAARHIFHDRLVGVLPPDAPEAGQSVTADWFVSRTYLSYSFRPQPGFEFEKLFRPASVVPAKILRLESLPSIITMIEAGQGTTVLPRWAVDEAAQQGRVSLAELNTEQPGIDWSLCHHPRLSERRLAGLALIAEAIEQEGREKEGRHSAA